MPGSSNLKPVALERDTHERRRQPRVDTTCNALMRLSAALTFRCKVRNLSMNAAQVLCEPRYALLVNRNRPVELSIAFPVDGAVKGFTAKCRAKYCEPHVGAQPAATADMVMGLEFLDLEQATRQLLAGFLGAFPE